MSLQPARDRRLLALDLGTTAVKVAVVETRAADGRCALLSRQAVETRASVGAGAAGEREQSIAAILAAVNEGVGLISAELLASCDGLTVCDQMHGVVLWDSCDPARASRLITWEDGRADAALQAAFNAELSQRPHGAPVFAGYGLVTLAALLRSRHPWVTGPAAFDCAGTLGTYVANVLAGRSDERAVDDDSAPPRRPAVLTDPSDAASWGCFDVLRGEFDGATLAAVSPALLRLLPRVVPTGTALGSLSAAGARALGLATTLAPLLPAPAPSTGVPAAAAASVAAAWRPLPPPASATGDWHARAPPPPLLQLADDSRETSGSGSGSGLRVDPPSQSTAAAPPLVYVSTGDHAAATTAALAFAVRLAQAQVASQASLRSRLRRSSSSYRSSSLSSLPSHSEPASSSGGGGDGGGAGCGSGGGHHPLPSPASSQLSLGGGSITSDEGDDSGVGDSHHRLQQQQPLQEPPPQQPGGLGDADSTGALPGMGRLTVVVINVGTAAQVAACGSAVGALLEPSAARGGDGGPLPRLPPGVELRPLPRVRLDGAPPPPPPHLQPPPCWLRQQTASERSAAGDAPPLLGLPLPLEEPARDTAASPAASPAVGGAAAVAAGAASHSAHAGAGAAAAAPPAAAPPAPPHLMLVAASVNGGSVLAFLAERLTRWGSALQDMQARARATGPATGASPLLGPQQRSAEWSTRATYFFLESEAAKVFLHPPTVTAGGSGGGAFATAVAGVAVRPTLARERSPVGFSPPAEQQQPLSSDGRVGTAATERVAAAPGAPLCCCCCCAGSSGGACASSSSGSGGGGLHISGLALDNSDSPGALYAAAAQAVVHNVCSRLPPAVWRRADIVVATGGAVFKSAVLRKCISDWVAHAEASAGRARGAVQVVVMDEGGAEYAGCIGAALAAAHAV